MIATSGGGHAVPGTASAMTEPAELLDIDTSTETIETPPSLAKVKEEDKTDHVNVVAPPPDHTHPFPVANHDARPHDPSQPHDHAPPSQADHDHDHDHDRPAGAPAEAANVVGHDSNAAMPVFSMASGNGSMTAGSTRVADAKGGGAGNGAATAASGDGAASAVTYSVNAVSAPAKLVSSVTAAYPTDARADDVEGDVGLEIVVDVEGRVVDARVVTRAGHGFDESAVAAIKRYRFSAAQRQGRNVRVRMPWTVQFRLR